MRSDYAGLARKSTRQADCHCLINNEKTSNVFINSCNLKVQVLTECDLRIRVASISRQNIRLDSFVTKKISVLSWLLINHDLGSVGSVCGLCGCVSACWLCPSARVYVSAFHFFFLPVCPLYASSCLCPRNKGHLRRVWRVTPELYLVSFHTPAMSWSILMAVIFLVLQARFMPGFRLQSRNTPYRDNVVFSAWAHIYLHCTLGEIGSAMKLSLDYWVDKK